MQETDMDDRIDEAVDIAARLIVEANHVIALVGAGMSVESGVPTFRGPGGLWTRLGEPSMNGFREFTTNPVRWWQQQEELQKDPVLAEFREAIEKAEPNAGHYALVELERLGLLKMTITQNVDDLHFRAGSERVAEMHGNRTKLRCIGCQLRWPRQEFVTRSFPPECPECGGLVKSDTVMFGEPIPYNVLKVCFEQTELADWIIVAGTSATVYPAASFPETVKDNGGRVIEANPDATPLSHLADVTLRMPTGESLPMVVAKAKELSGQP